MKDKILLNCVFHKEKSPSMVVDKTSGSFFCIGCGVEGLTEYNDLVKEAVFNHENENLHFGSFKDQLIDRCNDRYPIQIVLNSGIIIECLTDEIEFYDDHFQIYRDEGRCKAGVKYPSNLQNTFYPRHIWVPYNSISFVTDATS